MVSNYMLADLIAKIKNGQQAYLTVVEHRNSKLCKEFLEVLLREGFIQNFYFEDEDQGKIIIELKYVKNQPAIFNIECYSRPGKRVYASLKSLWEIKNKNFGVVVLSTSKGVLTHREARKLNTSGEILCVVS